MTQDIACMCSVNKSNNIVAKNKSKKSKKYKHVNIHGTNTKWTDTSDKSSNFPQSSIKKKSRKAWTEKEEDMMISNMIYLRKCISRCVSLSFLYSCVCFCVNIFRFMMWKLSLYTHMRLNWYPVLPSISVLRSSYIVQQHI